MKTHSSVYLLLSLWFLSASIHQIEAFSRPLQHYATDPRVKGSVFPPASLTTTPTSERSSSLCLVRRLRNRFSQNASLDLSPSSAFGQTLTKRNLFSKLQRYFRIKTLKQWLLACAILLASSTAPAMARSGGRIGGTYSRPSRPSMSRPARPHRRPLPARHHYPGPARTVYHFPAPVYRAPVGYSTTTVVQSPFVRELHPRQVTASDIVLWTGTGLAVTYGVRNHYKNHLDDLNNSDNRKTSSLGPGASVASMTVALQVPDRTDSNSILKDLEQKAMVADTNTRKGLQYVVSETALELLRKELSIVSVDSSIQHFRTVGQAQMSFQQSSILRRSKLDRESGKETWSVTHRQQTQTHTHSN
jgi:hypothetical protein